MAGYYIPLVGTPQIGDSGGGGGGGAGGLLVNVTKSGTASVCDKTAGETMAVFGAGGGVVFKTYEAEDELYIYNVLSTVEITPDGYNFSASTAYTADSADDYPHTSGK